MDKIKSLLKEMGLSDEQISKFVSEAITDKFVPKHRFDEINEKNKQLTEDVSSRDTQIKELSKFEGDNEALKSKIEKLEKANAEKDEQNALAIKNLKIDNAVNYALSGKIQEGYEDLVMSLIDKSLITLKDDGTVGGLTEQIEKATKDKPLLFKSSSSGDDQGQSKQNGWSFKGQDPKDANPGGTKSLSENFVESLLAGNKEVAESTKTATEYYFGTK